MKGQSNLPRDDDHYLAFIREQPCCVCGGIDVEAHHPRIGFLRDDAIVDGTGPGGAQRADDRWAVPLCNRHHRELHGKGDRMFWAELGIDPFKLALGYQILVQK